MKKVLFILTAVLLYGCTCIGQIPTQYVYVDEDCNAFLPDYSGMVVVSDNCSVVTLTQVPVPGTVISTTTAVQLRAVDSSGNTSVANFDAVILDTIAPLIQYDTTLIAGGYTDEQIGDMYKVVYGWVQEQGDKWNATAPGTEVPITTPDTSFIYTLDSMIYFHMTIPITMYRADEGYWDNTSPNLSAYFDF